MEVLSKKKHKLLGHYPINAGVNGTRIIAGEETKW